MPRSLPRPCRLRSILVVLAAAVTACVPALRAGLDVVSTAPAQAQAATARIADGDPVDAAIAVSRRRFPSGTAPRAVLVRDDTFADALAAAPLTGDAPLLMTGGEALDRATADELQRVLSPLSTVLLLGGDAALSDRVEAEVMVLGLRPVRVAGDDRVATALAVADVVAEDGPVPRVALARAFGAARSPSSGWADAIAAGPWAAATRTPVLLTPGDAMDERVAAWLRRAEVDETIVLGGEAALDDAVVRRVPSPRRVAGSDRAGTAVAVADLLVGQGARARAWLLDLHADEGWAYGLAAAGLVAHDGGALVATRGTALPAASRAWLSRCDGARPGIAALGPDDVTRRAAIDAASATGCTVERHRADDSHAFVRLTKDGTPYRYDPCRTITFAVNLDGAPAGASARLDRAMALLSDATGLRFARTRTDERLAHPHEARGSYVDEQGRWRPVLVNWPADWSRTDAVGLAGSAYVNGPSAQYVSGVVSLRPGVDGDVLSHVLLHELGHLVGLSHVADRSQVMYEAAQPRLQDYAAGDLAGLRELGAARGCIG